MSTSIDDAVAVDVTIAEGQLHVRIDDGRTISVPLTSFPKLAGATAEERREWRLVGAGEGIHWPALDEDVSIAALLRGS